ncbi:protein STRUBBELIG-RECEPTOR FAMILY 3-like isoform X1 [Vicia villosa]|uniref:protein STRUBBELIG-RECEPTOR FAMILY 3-like isoform X1 n=2 Tax=Vicia villosa TaxID=3911 RepID=UPI00273C7EAA|nr:protein STRUBBELIG-RECEPTOR FAMILY 3-like isoform X1 [Vicia villosa]
MCFGFKGGSFLSFEKMGFSKSELHVPIFVTSMIVILMGSFCVAETDPVDVAALNSLYAAMESPPLLGWKPEGGDPCLEIWQGVECVFTNITSIRLVGLNLGGELGSNLDFPSIIELDLSNNHIGGAIPFTLPPTLTSLSLARNRLNGSIPDALSLLSFLATLDLADNNLTGELPSSMGSLSSLTALRLQNNQLGGTLLVLQDLPLEELNIENNLFSGPIPPNVLNIPNLKKDGNPFNTSIIPTLPALAPSPEVTGLSPEESPWHVVYSPSDFPSPSPGNVKKSFLAKHGFWIAGAGVLIFIALGICVCTAWCCKRNPKDKNSQKLDVEAFPNTLHKPTHNDAAEKTSRFNEVPNRRTNSVPKVQDEQDRYVNTVSATSEYNNVSKPPLLQPPPHPLPIVPVEKVTVNSAVTTNATERKIMTSSVKMYTVASLQQYTNSFSQENLIGEGTLGSVYRAELPDGKLLAVKKLDTRAFKDQTDEQFLQLVSSISKIQHVNIAKLVGYCAEYNQRLLIYEYCNNGTLQDALHGDDEHCIKFPWNERIKVALGAARALEYLHENFQPPIVHRNFRSANVLLNEKSEVCVSDCGLGHLLSSGAVGQLSGRLLTAYGYSAPEFESGSYTQQSDVFSFGVVMLELLTGRKSHDRSRPRGEQFLVRWAVPQLHDIDALSKMVDPHLNGSYSMKSLSRFADIVSSCIQREPEFRPAMSEIVQDLLLTM